MAQPTLNILTIDPAQASWEANVNTNFDTLKDAFDTNPLIVVVFTSRANLPTASANEETLALVAGDATPDFDGLYHSDGTTWRLMAQLDYESDGQLLISHDGAVVGKLRRRSNTATNQVQLDLALNDSASAEEVYGAIAAEIIVNTAGAEEGDVVLKAIIGGTLTEVLRLHGLEQHGRFAGSQGIGSVTLTNANLLTDKVDGDEIWISDGRKTGEGAAAGTGLRAYFDTTAAAWFRHADDTAVVV